ncbi:MAG: hypothetical protein CM1200mP29_02080 [Verrucomicrobiota bacterium]|nr:MAG: hypothetical protein CM1200mP29_02080 [Verrucomicrobiota bacterium]
MVVDIALLREVYGFGVGVESRGLYIRPELAQVRPCATADIKRGLNLTIATSCAVKSAAERGRNICRSGFGMPWPRGSDVKLNFAHFVEQQLDVGGGLELWVLLEVYSVPSGCSGGGPARGTRGGWRKRVPPGFMRCISYS